MYAEGFADELFDEGFVRARLRKGEGLETQVCCFDCPGQGRDVVGLWGWNAEG